MQKLFSDVYLLAYSMSKEGMQCVQQGFKKTAFSWRCAYDLIVETRKKINNINYIVEVLKYKDQLLDILPHLYSITQEMEAEWLL